MGDDPALIIFWVIALLVMALLGTVTLASWFAGNIAGLIFALGADGLLGYWLYRLYREL